MPDRRDAFLAAAEIALALEAAAKSTGAIDSVATTGVCDIFPRAINSIPSRVLMEADIRDIHAARRDGMIEQLQRTCDEVGARRRVSIALEFINRDAPATCDPRIVDAIADAAARHGLACDRMVSRAYHDSLFMSRICPAAMIFIPCRDGVSHRPDEYSSPEAIARGATVLAETLSTLAG
jgi:N-carbamoyl-L-amino-acid hydrolase